jgi:NADPH2:quinone reductase
MHAWLCENPTGIDALTWKELPTPVPGRRGAGRDQGCQPELSRPADRAEQIPDQAAPALCAGLRIRGHGPGGRRRRAPAEGRPEHRLPVRHGGVRHPHHRQGAVHAAAERLPARGRCGIHHDLCHLIPCADRSRSSCKAGETVLVLGAAGGVGTSAIQIAKPCWSPVIAAASTDEKCALCTRIGADATINYSSATICARPSRP